MPTHLRYELRPEIFNLQLQIADEYLFLFADGDSRRILGVPCRAAQAGARTVPGSRWWPVIHRRAERYRPVRGDDTAVDIPRCA